MRDVDAAAVPITTRCFRLKRYYCFAMAIFLLMLMQQFFAAARFERRFFSFYAFSAARRDCRDAAA